MSDRFLLALATALLGLAMALQLLDQHLPNDVSSSIMRGWLYLECNTVQATRRALLGTRELL